MGTATPDFPDGEARESALVAGTVYKSELNEKQTVLYLKQTILIKQANLTAVQQEYPFDRIKVRIKNQKSGVNIGVGDRVLLRGDLEEIPIPGNPGQFHERAYYYARKVKWYQKGRSIQVLEKEYDAILGFQEKIKKALGIGLHKAFSKEKAGIMEAMLLGSKENMEKEINFLFQILGCSHILAVSGLHLSVLGGGLFRLLRKCSVPLWGAAGISAFSMFFYGGVTGNGASVLRASIMFAVYMGSFMLKRTSEIVCLLFPLRLFYFFVKVHVIFMTAVSSVFWGSIGNRSCISRLIWKRNREKKQTGEERSAFPVIQGRIPLWNFGVVCHTAFDIIFFLSDTVVGLCGQCLFSSVVSRAVDFRGSSGHWWEVSGSRYRKIWASCKWDFGNTTWDSGSL